MKYKFDHDYHIHSQISACSGDPLQTPEAILKYAEENGLDSICITDHFWDSDVPGASKWYAPQNYERISAAKPLPQSENVKFMFGCETEVDKFFTLGLAEKNFDLFDFIIIPTTHLHMTGFTISEDDAQSLKRRAELWPNRFDRVLKMPLPFHKVGIAHLTCGLIARSSREDYLNTLEMIPSETMKDLFTRAAKCGVGIELNCSDMKFKDEEADIVLRPYKIAKECGCKFYLGSDAHHPNTFDEVKAVFERAIDMLALTEDDKFHIK